MSLQDTNACELRAHLLREMQLARQTLQNPALDASPELRAQYLLLETLLETVETLMLTDAMDDMALQPSAL